MATVSPSKKLMKKPTAAAAPAAAPVKTPTKGPVAKTAAKPAAAKTADKVEAPAEAASVDVIAKTAQQIENLNAEKAFSQVASLRDDIEQNYFRLGGVLAKVAAEGWYQDKGHENFKAWCEAEGGIEYRKAMYLIAIYNGLVESGVAWEKVGHLGWSKLKELAKILSPDNVDEWVAVAENMTVLQLIAAIKEATKGSDSGNAPEPGASSAPAVGTKTFKLHADQRKTVDDALEKAKHEGSTEHDAVALEYICMDFMAGGKGAKGKTASLSDIMKKKSVEEVLGILDTVFPKLVVQAALYETVEEAEAARAELEAAAEEGEAEGGEGGEEGEATEEAAEEGSE